MKTLGFRLLRVAGLLPLAITAAGCGRTDRASGSSVGPGIYRAVLQLPGGELPFGLDLEREGPAWAGYLINGPERLKLDEVTVDGSHLQIRMPGFENRLTADLHGNELHGEIVVSKPGGHDQHIPFSAEFKQTYRFFPQPSADHADVSGRWKVTFSDEDGQEEAAVGEFTQSNDVVTGTFLTNGGDHRYLAGQVQGNQLYLSTFDGAHAFLYKAQVTQPGDAFTGDFWSGLALHRHFVAKRDAQAALSDPYSVTALRTGDSGFDFAFPDLDGKSVTSKDAKFRGKVVVVALAGSWCPNCHDEAAFLEPLYKEYRGKGLEVVALMFEHFGDFARAKEATERFRQQYGIEYSTLIAGLSDVDEAGRKLPMLQKFYGFPTTVIVDRNGQVRKIHTGFSGPATGEHYKQFVNEFRSNLEQLLAEPVNGA
jgi:thiol-disulfide isomerase/thioredoxin